MKVFIPCIFLVCLGLAGCSQDRKISRGAALYAANCAVCHGADGRGGGGANVPGLSKTPPDLTVLTSGQGGEFPVIDVLDALDGYTYGTHAGRRMVPFDDLKAGKTKRIRAPSGRVVVPTPQADLFAYLKSRQRP